MPPNVRRLLQAALIVLAVLIIFWPALDGNWLWDDEAELTRNSALRSVDGLYEIWFAPKTPDYFPLKTTVQWLLWQLWQDGRVAHHLTSVLFHCFGALMVWSLLARLGVRLAWWGGFLFAVHPLAVESVAWIAELKNTTSLPLLLLAARAYLDFDESGKRKHYVAAVLWFLAAMLCKSSVVMLPVALLLYAWWKRGRITRSDLAASSTFFAIALVLGLTTIWFQHTRSIGGWEIDAGSIPTRIARAGLAIAFYFSKSILPVNLAPIYPQWDVEPPSLLQFLPWPILGFVVFWFWTKRARWGRHALLGFGWFVLHLVPVLGFIAMTFMRYSWVADHFAYISLVGVVGLGAAGASALVAHLQARGHPVMWSACALVALTLAWRSRIHASRFHTPEAFWTHAIAMNPTAWAAHNNLGSALLDQGEAVEALAHFEEALRLKPETPSALYNSANALTQLDRLPEAIARYHAVLEQEPAHVDARVNLGNALLRSGRSDEALREYRRATETDPAGVDVRVNIGNALAAAGRLAEAVPMFEQALRLDAPAEVHAAAAFSLAEVHQRLGLAAGRAGHLREALTHFETAVRLRPDFAEAHANLGNVWLQSGRPAEAVAAYERALQLDPQLRGLQENLELARAALRRGSAR